MWLIVKCGSGDSCDGAEMDEGMACEANSVLLLSPGKKSSRHGVMRAKCGNDRILCDVAMQRRKREQCSWVE